jgi:hypothetical protein
MICEVVHNLDSTKRKSHEDYLPIKLWGAKYLLKAYVVEP